MKICAFLPAKGSSERVPNKNIALLNSKPLFLHSLEKLMLIDIIDEVYLDTDSDLIIDLASEVKCNVKKRPANLATNKTDGNALLLYEASLCEADIYVQLLCTSPFIEIETIKRAIHAVESGEYDSAITVKKEKQYSWHNGKPNYNIDVIPNSVTLDDSIIETMGLYVITREALQKTKRRIGNNPLLIPVSPIEAVDVNTAEEFKLANLIAIGQKQNDRNYLRSQKHLINSAMLSDILDDLGYKNHVIEGLKCNFPDQKIFGRAKTLKLRALKDGEDFKGIYKALQSYNYISQDDIIVVQNEVDNLAYFGELNAGLAIQSGASAAIINGKTRDSSAVHKFGFPVFSKGFNCKDVRRRATVESINKTIQLDNIECEPESLIFGDNDGIVIIPKKIEKEVLQNVIHRVGTEFKIFLDISAGRDTTEIHNQYGDF
jgi:CMP-N-acetylneuraminic acid synthetase/regulator of RNase E activity RraA